MSSVAKTTDLKDIWTFACSTNILTFKTMFFWFTSWFDTVWFVKTYDVDQHIYSIVYTYWLDMRVIALLLSSRYQLLSEATPRTIVVTEGDNKSDITMYPNITLAVRTHDDVNYERDIIDRRYHHNLQHNTFMECCVHFFLIPFIFF